MKKTIMWNIIRFLIPVIVPIVMVTISLLLTRYGGGISPDSFSYIAAARSMKTGEGIIINNVETGREPLTHFPPGVSMVLAVFPSDPAGTLRVLNAILIGVTIFLVGYTVFTSTKSLLSSAFSQLFVASQVDMLNTHIFLWSEPLFLSFIAGIFLSLALFQRTKKRRYIATAIGLAAVLPIIRYAGVVIIPFVLIALWLLTKGAVVEKLIRSILTGIVLVLPLGVWALIMKALQRERSIREFAIHIIEPARIQEGVTTLLSWIIPQSFVQANFQNIGIFFLIAIAIVGILIFLKKDSILKSLRNIDFIWLPILFAVGYISFLVISISFFDAYTPLDGRILSPMILMFGYFIGHILTQKNVFTPVLAIFILMIGFNVTS